MNPSALAASKHPGRAFLNRKRRGYLVDNPLAQEWLTLAFGASEAEKAMQLPQALRIELHEDVYCYGPAAEEISDFYDRILHAFNKNLDSGLSDALDILYTQVYLHGNDSVVNHLISWALDSSLQALYQKLYEVAWSADGDTVFHKGYRNDFLVIMMFLNGQYLFSEEMKERGKATMPYINSVLNHLGMSSLQDRRDGVAHADK